MDGADRYRLLHGPSATPPCRYGDDAWCERFGDCVLVGLHDAPIPWPVGKRKGKGQRSRPWEGEVRKDVSLLIPHIVVRGRPLSVSPALYGPKEYPHFRVWLAQVYLPECLPQYARRKFPRREFGLAPAIAADRACRRIVGRPAALPPSVRRQIGQQPPLPGL
jgi:hypothetical protein